MKLLILYKPVSELASSVESYAREFEREKGYSIQLLDIESHEGIDLAAVHDIVRSPVLLALRDDSGLIDMWLDRDSWPTMSQLSAYITNRSRH